MIRIFLAAAALFLAGCGGGSGPLTPATNTPNTPAPVTPAPGGGGSPASAPTVVAVTGGAITAGVNITVPAAASTAAPNIESLGVTDIGSAGTASNTGARIQRGASRRVILFGSGISESMQVIVGGPNDISVSEVSSVRSTSGKTGVSFRATVAANATPGARTVYLKAANNDITAFTGGLEVVP